MNYQIGQLVLTFIYGYDGVNDITTPLFGHIQEIYQGGHTYRIDWDDGFSDWYDEMDVMHFVEQVKCGYEINGPYELTGRQNE